MGKKITVVAILLFSVIGYAQIGFKQHKIDSINGKGIVSFIDSDNDGDLDIINEDREKKELVYYENLDGKGEYGKRLVIDDSIPEMRRIKSVDIDNDGDNDLLIAGEGGVIWYKNESDEFILNKIEGWASSRLLHSVHASDIDNDGDFDIISYLRNGVVWYENIDGKGNFSKPQMIAENTGETATIYDLTSGDIDGDGDMDVVSGYHFFGEVFWHENIDGKGTFGEQKLVFKPIGNSFNRMVLVLDVDNDKDMDIVSFTDYGGTSKVYWSENLKGKGEFNESKLIGHFPRRSHRIMAADLDQDNDLDIVCSFNTKDFSYIENIDGLGNFGKANALHYDKDAYSIDCGDVDNDGDIDIITTNFYSSGDFIWFENTGQANNKINGKVLFDYDFNGCDTSDIKMSQALVMTSSDKKTTYSSSLENGFYQSFVGKGKYKIKLSPNFLGNRYKSIPESYTFNFDANNAIEMADFCLEAKGEFNDVAITIVPVRQARPGFVAKYKVVYTNNGTTQVSGNSTLQFNGEKLNFKKANKTTSAETENSIAFDYLDLKPFESRKIYIQFDVLPPPTVNIDDILTFTATINPVQGDETEQDNVFVLEQKVIGSYDPNDIAVLQGKSILEEEKEAYLNYVIRFQNTGTASAINVKVDNILDDKLDWNTIQLQDASHDNRIEIVNGNQVSFIFDNINLIDSTANESGSHGYIAYKIKPKSTVKVGDIISNQASIYFDFNEAVVTNTVTTQIEAPLLVNKLNVSQFTVSPNPTTGVLKIAGKSKIKAVVVYNNIGQVVISEQDKSTINLSLVTSGLYFIKLTDEKGNTEIKKVVKN